MVRATRRRTFTIADAMVLLAALAAGLYFARARFLIGSDLFPRTVESIPDVATTWAVLLLPGLEVGTVAVALLALRQPRPPLRRMTLRPGFTACWAAAVILAIGAAVDLLQMGVGTILSLWPGGWVPYQDYWITPMTGHLTKISYTVAVCWLLMAVGGRWRPEPDWVDRVGRGLGSFWVGMIAIYPFLYD
jgi:hypothetical protein